MSRNKGTFNFSANFEVLAKAPLDARMLVGNYSDLVLATTWEDLDNNIWLFDGAIVSVSSDPSKGLYFLTDAVNYTNFTNWLPVGSGTVTDSSIGVLNIGDGSANVFAGYDASGNITLRTISASEGVIVQQLGDVIYIGIDSSISSSVTYDTTLDPSLSMPVDVGGYPSGTLVNDLSGDQLIVMWDNLLFPTVDPVYVNPNNLFSDNTVNLHEVNELINVTYTATLSKGSITVSGNFQDFRSGDANAYFYTDPSSDTLLVDVSSASLSDIQPINNYVVLIGSQSWTSRTSYDQGPQPEDNKGNPSGSPLVAGTTGFKSISLEGVYPIFATTSNITTLTKQTLISMSTGTTPGYTLEAETGGNKQKFQIPDKWTGAPTNNPLVGIQTYNTFASQWEYSGGSAANSLLTWTTIGITQNIQGITENYTQYTYNGTDRSNTQIRLVF